MENNMENINSMATLGNTPTPSSTSSIVSVLKYIAVAFVIIVLLAVGGINLFNYLAIGTQDAATGINDTAAYIKEKTKNSKVKVGLKNIIGVSAMGTEDVINATTGTINAGLNQIIQATGAPGSAGPSSGVGTPSSGVGTPLVNTVPPPNTVQNNPLNQTINKSTQGSQGYEADTSGSNIQQKGKSGWCYIGESRGVRTCAQVSTNDVCMSGDIFPSNDICVNPNLRP